MTVQRACGTAQSRVTVSIRPPRAHLVYSVEVRGTQPVFALEDALGRVLLSSDQRPDHDMVWTRHWPQATEDIPPAPRGQITHVLTMSFLGSSSADAQYNYKVWRRGGGGRVKLIKDCVYTSTQATDEFREPLIVRLVR